MNKQKNIQANSNLDLEKKIYIVKSLDSNTEIVKDENTIIYAWDYFTSQILSQRSLEHRICDKIISSKEMSEIDSTALEIAITWYQNNTIQNILRINKINLGFLVEWELFHYLIQTIKDYFMLEKILEQEKPHKVIIIGDINKIETICEEKDILYEIKKSNNKNNKFIMDFVEIKYDIFNHPISFKISLKKFHWIKKQYEKMLHVILKIFSYKNKKNKSNKNFLLLEFNPASYSDLLYVAKKNNINIKLLNFRRPAVWNANSFKIIRNSGCEIINHSINKKNNNVNDMIYNLKEFLNNDVNLSKIFSINNKSFWFFIKEDFTNFCISRFSLAIQEIETITTLLKNQKIDCILGWNDSLQTEKTIMTIGKKMSIPTVVLQHGLVSHSDNANIMQSRFRISGLLPLVSDYFAVWGKIMQDYAIKLGMNKENVPIVGNPRYDSLFRNKKKYEKNKTILFATSGLGNNTVAGFTSEVLEKYKKSIETVCSTVKKLEGYELIVKLHPYSTDFIDIKEIIKNIDPTIKVIQNINLIQLIENCDILITYHSSTALLEAMIMEKPTIAIQLFDSKTLQEKTIFRYNTISAIEYEELDTTLRSLLDDKFSHTKIENGKKFSRDYLSHTTNSSEELLRFLQNL